MFRVNHSQFIDQYLPLLDGEPKVLLFDEVPILFTGKNKYGSFVIGKSVAEDYDKGIERYLHLVVTEDDYRNFNSGDVNYLELLKSAPQIFVVDKSVRTGKSKVGVIPFGKIPTQFLPTEHSFYPKALHEPSIEYPSAIKGGAAEDHLADSEDVSVIVHNLTNVLKKSLHALGQRIGFHVQPQLRPSTASSFGINFVIKLIDVPEVFIANKQLLSFVNQFTEFCMKDLPTELDAMLAESPDGTSSFDSLVDKALEIAPIYTTQEEEKESEKRNFRDALRKDVLAVPPLLKPVAETVAKSYKSFIIGNKDLTLGTIDKAFIATLETVNAKLESITKDDRSRSFQMMVYRFNKKTGKGLADVFVDRQKSQISFHIIGYKSDDGGPYCVSMTEDRLISVQGLMEFKALRPHSLEIYS